MYSTGEGDTRHDTESTIPNAPRAYQKLADKGSAGRLERIRNGSAEGRETKRESFNLFRVPSQDNISTSERKSERERDEIMRDRNKIAELLIQLVNDSLSSMTVPELMIGWALGSSEFIQKLEKGNCFHGLPVCCCCCCQGVNEG